MTQCFRIWVLELGAKDSMLRFLYFSWGKIQCLGVGAQSLGLACVNKIPFELSYSHAFEVFQTSKSDMCSPMVCQLPINCKDIAFFST